MHFLCIGLFYAEVGFFAAGLVVTVTGDCKDGGDCVTGQRTVTAREGVATFHGINIVAQPGDYLLSFNAIGVLPMVANFSIRDCRPGEVNSTTGGLNVCQNCSTGEYSFLPEVMCMDVNTHCYVFILAIALLVECLL